MNRLSVPSDNDADGDCDVTDADDDNDNVLDGDDAFPFNPTESKDTDGDGVGDNTDMDDDDDGWLDTTETVCRNMGGFGTQLGAVTPADLDSDRVCDALDQDRDGDGVRASDEGLIASCEIQPWEDASQTTPPSSSTRTATATATTPCHSHRGRLRRRPNAVHRRWSWGTRPVAGLGLAMRSQERR